MGSLQQSKHQFKSKRALAVLSEDRRKKIIFKDFTHNRKNPDFQDRIFLHHFSMQVQQREIFNKMEDKTQTAIYCNA